MRQARIRLSKVEINGKFSIKFDKKVKWPEDIHKIRGMERGRSTSIADSDLHDLVSVRISSENDEDQMEGLDYTWVIENIDKYTISCKLLFKQP